MGRDEGEAVKDVSEVWNGFAQVAGVTRAAAIKAAIGANRPLIFDSIACFTIIRL